MNPEDLDKCQAVIDGDVEAIKWLFMKYQPRMFCFCNEFFHNDAISKDLVQDAFVSMIESCSNINDPHCVVAYLFGILRNRCLKEVRAKAIRSRFQNIDSFNLQEMELSALSSNGNILDDIFTDELESWYRKAIRGLSEQCRLIFYLSRDKGMQYKDIAKKLNISQRTVENEVYRGLRVLKESLKGYAPLLIFIFFYKI
jgi:RNA polymerase sigma-70 factor (ECF subfamily)